MNLDATIQAFAQIPRADAVAQFQLLQSVEQALARAGPKVVADVLSSMETAFVPIIICGTTPPVRRAVLGCFRIAFSKVSRNNLHVVIGNLEAFLKPKPKGSAPELPGTVSSLEIMGGLCVSFGKQLIAYFPDNIKTFSSHLRNADPGARVAAIQALTRLMEGSCALTIKPDWSEVVKVTIKASTDVALDVRVGAAKCMVAMAQHKGFLQTAPHEAEQLLKTALQNLEAECGGMATRPSVMGRTALATSLGAMLAAMAEFDFGLQQRKDSAAVAGEDRYAAEEEPKSARKSGRKREKTKAAQEESPLIGGLAGGVRYLVRPFAVLGASRLLRTALIHSFTVFFQCISNNERQPWDEGALVMMVPEILMGMLGGGTKLFTSVPEIVHARECVRYILHEGLAPLCGERGLRMLLEELIDMAKQPNANGTVIVVALLELCSLVEVLGDSIDDIMGDAVDVVMKSVGRAGSPVRSSASLALRAIVTQYPANLPSFITESLQTIKVAQAEMSMDSEVQRQIDLMHGNSVALAALLAEIPNCDAGIPTEFMDSLLDFGMGLLTNKTARHLNVLVAQRESGWNIIAGIVAGLDPIWLAAHVDSLMDAWNGVLGKQHMDALAGVQNRDEQQGQIEIKTHSLSALTALLVRAVSLSCASVITSRASGFLNNVLVRLPSFSAGPATNQLRLKLLEAYEAFLPLASSHLEDSSTVPFQHILKAAMDEALQKTGTSKLRGMLNPDDMLLWGPQREDWFAPDDLDEFRLYAEDNMKVWGATVSESIQVAGVPFSLRICDTAVKVAGLVISVAPEQGERYITVMLEQIKLLKNKPTKKKDLHATLKAAFDLSKNAAGILLTAYQTSADEGRTVSHDGMLTKSMDLLSTLLLEDNAVIRCASAEAFGLLARVAVDRFRKTCIKFLVNCMRNPKREPPVRGSFAFAIGCVCRYTGTLWHPSVVDVMGTLQSGNQFPMPAVRVWTLYASSLAISHGGALAAEYLPSLFRQAQLIAHAAEDLRAEAKVTYVVNTYIALSRLLRSTGDAIAAAESAGMLGQITDHLGNDEIMVIVHELIGQITEVREHPGVEPEYIRMLGGIWSAPGAMMERVRTELAECLPLPPIEYLRTRLDSLRVEVRQAAVKSLAKAYARAHADQVPFLPKDGDSAIAMLEGLFRFLDNEYGMGGRSSLSACASAKHLIDEILKNEASTCSFQLMGLLRRVTLGQKKEADVHDEADFDGQEGEVPLPELTNTEEVVQLGAPRNPYSSKLDSGVVLRWRTKLVAIPGVKTVLAALDGIPEHFDAKLAQASANDCMVNHLPDLIGIASSSASAPFGAVRLKGLQLLQDILVRFGQAEDPYMEGARLLEQFNAQIGAALRGSFPSDDAAPQQHSVSPVTLSHAIIVLQNYLKLGIVPASDAVAMRRLLGLLLTPLGAEDILGSLTAARNFDDVTECRLLVTLYAAVARLYLTFADSPAHPIFKSVAVLTPALGKACMDMLKDFACITIYADANSTYASVFFKRALLPAQITPLVEGNFATILQAAYSWAEHSRENVEFLLGLAVAFIRGRVGDVSSRDVAEVVARLSSFISSDSVRDAAIPAQQYSELITVVYTATRGEGSANARTSVARLVVQVLQAVPPSTWDEGGGVALARTIVEVTCELLSQPAGMNAPQTAIEAAIALESLGSNLPSNVFIQIAPCAFAALVHCSSQARNIDKVLCNRLISTVQALLTSVTTASMGRHDALHWVLCAGASAAHAAGRTVEQGEAGGQDRGESSEDLQLVAQLGISVSLLLYTAEQQPETPPPPPPPWASSVEALASLLATVLSQGLRSEHVNLRRPCVSALIKLGQGLAAISRKGLSPVFSALLHHCGGGVVAAILHQDAGVQEVREGISWLLLALNTAVEPDLRATLCSTLVPTLIALIERDQTLRDSSARLAASICLKLAKEPSLAADFKAQVARLLPQARATLEAGLRATMATAASPASNRSRAASGSSAGAGRRKPAIALRTDFG